MRDVPPTYQQRLLAIVAKLPPGWDREDAAIAAAQADPQAFALKRHPEQCDTKKIADLMYGHRGLVPSGWIQGRGAGGYDLTREGRLVLHRLANPAPAPGTPLNRPTTTFVQRLYASRAAALADAGRRHEITRREADGYWVCGGGRQSTGDRLRLILDTLGDDWASVMPSQRKLTAGDVRALLNLHEWLNDRWRTTHAKPAVLAGR